MEKKTRQAHILLTKWQKEHLKSLKEQLGIAQGTLCRAMINKGIREIELALFKGKRVELSEEVIINAE
jgi:predicted DNA-binding protein